MKSSIHTNKEIVTVGQFIDIVKNRDWRLDISYLAIEERTEGEWKETELVPLTEVFDLSWEKGQLRWHTSSWECYVNTGFSGVPILALEDADNVVEPRSLRYTVYIS